MSLKSIVGYASGCESVTRKTLWLTVLMFGNKQSPLSSMLIIASVATLDTQRYAVASGERRFAFFLGLATNEEALY